MVLLDEGCLAVVALLVEGHRAANLVLTHVEGQAEGVGTVVHLA